MKAVCADRLPFELCDQVSENAVAAVVPVSPSQNPSHIVIQPFVEALAGYAVGSPLATQTEPAELVGRKECIYRFPAAGKDSLKIFNGITALLQWPVDSGIRLA